MTNHQHVVMWSGGITSWATARLVIERHGRANTTLLFADTNAEDPDLHRWNRDACHQLGMDLIRVADPQERDPWQVFEDKQWIGNTRIAQCSHILKQDPCRAWLEANRDPASTVIYVGLDWSEPHRIPGVVSAWLPWRAETPLAEPPYRDKEQWFAAARDAGLKIPRLYELGFAHNNCGGGVRPRGASPVGPPAGSVPRTVREDRGIRAAHAYPSRQRREHPPRPHRRRYQAAHAGRTPYPHRGPARPA